jgi:hypothetical protein
MTMIDVVRQEAKTMAAGINKGATVDVRADEVLFYPSKMTMEMSVGAKTIASLWNMQRYLERNDKVVIQANKATLFICGKVEECGT